MTMRYSDIKGSIEAMEEGFKLFVEKNNERLSEYLNRLEELESNASRPGRSAPRTEQEHVKAFTDWLRKPNDVGRRSRLEAAEAKAVTIASDPAGGYAVPTEISRDIERHELLLSPVRRICRVVSVSTSDFKFLLNLRGATAGWVGESGTRSATGTPSLREIVPTHGELYAYPQVSEWALQDVFFDLAAWLAQEVAEQFALYEGDAVIRGDGSDKLTGLLNATPVTTDDFASPLRAAAALEYIPITGSPLSLASDDLISLVYRLRAPYRAGAVFVMNSATAGIVAKLKDGQQRYIWSESLQAGQPARLLGYPVEIWEQLDDASSNKFPIAFGNFQRGYVIVQRSDLRITPDPYTAVGHVKFYIRRREGGIVLNNDAIKLLKWASS